ncbi:MAG: DUF6941 family protein [Opitutaceae bacterium]
MRAAGRAAIVASMENEPVVMPAILLSDGAIREHGTGKVSYIGCFAQWNAHRFPFQAPPFFITPIVANLRRGGDAVSAVIRIEKKGGLIVWSSEGRVTLPPHELPEGLTIELPTPALGVVFPEPNLYTISVLIEGDTIGRRDFFVRAVAAPPQPPAPGAPAA